MALALSLRFDPETTAAVDRIWRELAAAGISSDMLDLGYPPHLTLVVTDDEALVPAFSKRLAALAALAPRQIRLGGVGGFAGTEVVYLGCDGDLAGLRELHRLAAACVPLESIRPHYRPDAWTPHVTLQTAGDAVEASRIARGNWQPRLNAVPVRLELATFMPVFVGPGVDLS